MDKLKELGLGLAILIIGLLSWALLNKSNKLNDTYDDLLDAKAELKVKTAFLKASTALKDYATKKEKFDELFKEYNKNDIDFTPDNELTSDSPKLLTEPKSDRPKDPNLH